MSQTDFVRRMLAPMSAKYTTFDRARARQIADQQTVHERCLWCDWQWEGLLVEGREQHRQHRQEQHP